MNKLTYKLLTTLCLASLLGACDTNISDSVDDFEPSAGDADFSSFVTIGDSLTAAIADGALYRDAQQNSFPAILAEQFGEAVDADEERAAARNGRPAARSDGIDFEQPLMPKKATGSLTFMGGDLGIMDRLVAVASGDDDIPVTPATIKKTKSTAVDTPLPGIFNNMGVPGAKSFHLLSPGYGNPAGFPNANPFFTRFASDPATTSVIADTVAQAPTFFILWIGSNDVLSYATSGGTGVDQNAANNINPATYGSDDITDDVAFADAYSSDVPVPGSLIASLTAMPDTQGVLVNIAEVTSIPYFTTVPFDALPLEQDDVDDLAALEAGYNGALDALVPGVIDQDEADARKLDFSVGQNPIVISDETLTPVAGFLPAQLALFDQARQATEDDLILLPVASKLGEEGLVMGTVWGVTYPLEDGDVLIPDELDAIETARTAFNATIEAAADANDNLVMFDAASKLEELATTGINYGSGGVSAAFIQGGAFSLDGIHPTQRGYAVVANEMIKVINDYFNANIAPVNPGDYPTIFYQD